MQSNLESESKNTAESSNGKISPALLAVSAFMFVVTIPNYVAQEWAIPVASLLALLALVGRSTVVYYKWDIVSLVFIFLTIWMALSIFLSHDIFASLVVLLKFILPTLVIFRAATVFGRDGLIDCVSICTKFIVVATMAFWFIYPARAVSRVEYQTGALKSFYPHRNLLAFILVLGLITLIFQRSRGRYRQLSSVSWGIVYFYLILQTKSSTAIFLLVLVLLSLVVVVSLRKVREELRGVASLALLGSLILSGFLLVAYISEFTGLVGRDATLTGRTEIWKTAWYVAQPNLMTGVGWGAAWSKGDPAGLNIVSILGFNINHSHNGYLDFVLQLGLCGTFLLILCLIGLCLRTLRRSVYDQSNASRYAFVIAVVLVVYGFVETGVGTPLGWMFLAISVTLSRSEAEVGTSRVQRSPFDRFDLSIHNSASLK